MMSYFSFIAPGMITTLGYSAISVFLGLILGLCLALSKNSSNRLQVFVVNAYISLFRGTPLLIQLMIFYFAVPQMTGMNLSASAAIILAFSLNSAAYSAETISAGIRSVDAGQFEAARSLGIGYFLTMRDIILPQALRRVSPSLVNELANLIKETAIISMIGEMDLMRRAQMVAAQEYTYFGPMLTAAACYYVMILTLTFVAKLVEKRFSL